MQRRKQQVTLTLEEARKRTPPVAAAEALRQNLQLVLLGSISDKDVKALAEGLKKRALEGDLKATKLLLDLLMGQRGGSGPTQVVMVDATGSQLAPLPTAALPSSDDKMEIMKLRAANGHAVFHPDDATHGNLE